MKLTIVLFTFVLLPAELLFTQNAWHKQFYDSTGSIDNIYFLNENTGWAIGFNGRIVHTTNGGETWDSQMSGTSEWLHSVYFINSDTGFIGSRGFILKTINSGLNWEKINIDTIIDKKVFEFHGLFFPSTDTSYILTAISKFDVDVFWYDWYYLKSTDGLKSFEINYIIKRDSAVIKYENLYFPNRNFFHNLRIGYKFTRSGLLSKTYDDGLTWINIGGFNAVYFVNPEVGYAIVNNGYGYGQGHMIIIKTTSGGE